MLGAHQLPDVHGHVTELVTEQAPQTHEGGRVTHDLLRIRHHFAPAGRSGAGEQTQPPLSSGYGHRQTGQSRTRSWKHFFLLLLNFNLFQIPRRDLAA